MPYTSPVDVLLLLIRDGRLLLALRENTGYADGLWNVPSGKLEAGEDLLSAIIREAKEEIAIDLAEARLATVLHVRNPGGHARVGMFFEATSWTGEPHNAEPHKCAGIGWYPLDSLPPNTISYTTAGVALYRRNLPFGLLGW